MASVLSIHSSREGNRHTLTLTGELDIAFIDGPTDPDPANGRAIRAYEKAGFNKEGVVGTREGRALLMVRNP